jgi:hypothetical protein
MEILGEVAVFRGETDRLWYWYRIQILKLFR